MSRLIKLNNSIHLSLWTNKLMNNSTNISLWFFNVLFYKFICWIYFRNEFIFLIKISEKSPPNYCDLKISRIKVSPQKLIRLYELARQRNRTRKTFQQKSRNIPKKIRSAEKIKVQISTRIFNDIDVHTHK